MHIGSFNTMSKECLEDVLVGTTPSEATTNYLDANGDSLTNLDELVNDFFSGTASMLDRCVVRISTIKKISIVKYTNFTS